MSVIEWPAGMGMGEVVGQFARVRGIRGLAPGHTRVTIAADPQVVQYRGADMPSVLFEEGIPAVIDENGYLTTPTAYGGAGARGVTIPASIGPSLVPSGFTYRLVIHRRHGGDVTFRFSLEAGQTLDVSNVEPEEMSAGVVKIIDTSAAERVEAGVAAMQELLEEITATDTIVVDPEGAPLVVTYDGDGGYTMGSIGHVAGVRLDGTLGSVALEQVEDVAAASTAARIHEVAGVVALPSTGPRVLEFYTVGAATIGGVAFPVDAAVVFRRTAAGAWNYARVAETSWVKS